MTERPPMSNEPVPPDNDNALEEGFFRILIGDVSVAIKRHEDEPSSLHRRELVRVAYAAIEGVIWLYRTDIAEAARDLDLLKQDEEFALGATNYFISDDGQIARQVRLAPMLAVFRLTARIAERIDADLFVRFDTGEWERLKQASAIRNRLTHPKQTSDLHLSESDVAFCIDSLFWILEIYTAAMDAVNSALGQHLRLFRNLVQKLKEGDPNAWELYNEVREKLSE